ncbi:hypothetical protein Tco_0650878 [Tanacetum coccineum]
MVLIRCLIRMKVLLPPYTREEWNGRHVLKDNILCKDIFKDPDVCRKALDQTITPAELKRTKSLLLLDLANRSIFLAGYVKDLHSKVTDLDGKLERMQKDYDTLVQENRELLSQKDDDPNKVKELQTELTDARVASIGLSGELSQTDAKLSDQALVVRDLQNQLILEKARSQGYKDDVDGLREEVTQFVGSGVESLVQKLLSSDEFHAALARVASLGINYSVKRRLHMGNTDVEFEAAAQKFSNFHVGAKYDFNKALVDFSTTPFPFLSKIVAASGCILSEMRQSYLSESFCGRGKICASSLPLANLCVSFALVNAYYFLRRFKFSLSASSFCLSDSWITRLVGMPIFAGITASVPYARLNGVSPLLVLGYEPITHLAILLPMLLLLDVASF